MQIKEAELLCSFLGDVFYDDDKLARFLEKNTLTLYSPDRHEAVSVILTPNGQVVRHFCHSPDAAIENGARTLNVWKRYLGTAIAKDKLTQEFQVLLDVRYSQRQSQKRLF
jgi:hypothetical protein